MGALSTAERAIGAGLLAIIIALGLWAARLEYLRAGYKADLTACQSGRELDRANAATATARAETGFVTRLHDATDTYADRAASRAPIAYEAGQHLVDPARVDAMKAANRDPRMEGIYSDYLAGWSKVSGGDLLTLYSATGSISGYGAWGLREYAGQPLSETPKLRGVLR